MRPGSDPPDSIAPLACRATSSSGPAAMRLEPANAGNAVNGFIVSQPPLTIYPDTIHPVHYIRIKIAESSEQPQRAVSLIRLQSHRRTDLRGSRALFQRHRVAPRLEDSPALRLMLPSMPYRL